VVSAALGVEERSGASEVSAASEHPFVCGAGPLRSGIYDEGVFGCFGCDGSAGSLPERSHGATQRAGIFGEPPRVASARHVLPVSEDMRIFAA